MANRDQWSLRKVLKYIEGKESIGIKIVKCDVTEHYIILLVRIQANNKFYSLHCKQCL